MNPHNLTGKGIWIWKIINCESGSADAIAARAAAARFTHVIVKICDGDDNYNIWKDGAQWRDYALELIPRLRNAGFTVWGWNYIYGDPPPRDAGKPKYWELEAQGNVKRINQLRPLGLQGFVIDAEREYETIPDRWNKAAAYMKIMRDNLPDFPLALASWKMPALHGGFAWAQFRAKIDLDMPQVYWIGAHNPAAQLDKSFQQFAAMQPQLPYLPAGPTFFEHNWRPTPQDLVDFLNKAVALNLPAANFWAWDHLGLRGNEPYNPSKLNFTAEWDAVANFNWPQAAPVVVPPPPVPAPAPAPQPPADILAQYFAALNTHSPDAVAALYNANAGHTGAQGTAIGQANLRAAFAALFARLPNAVFTMTGSNALGTLRAFTWTAVSGGGNVANGSDTLGLVNGRIQYHHTSYTIT
jgi:hypothetical protein